MLFEEFVNEAFSEKFKQDLVDKFKKQQPNLNPDAIQAYISRFERSKDNALIIQKDITKYTWKELEKALDALPVSNRIKAGKIDLNSNEALYNQDGLRVYEGSTKKLCIKYGNGYKWCISARGEDNMYYHYRLIENGSPYFVFDDNKPKSDPTHAAVVFAFKEGSTGRDDEEGIPKLFTYSDANNGGDYPCKTKDELVEAQPYLNKVADLFVYKAPVDKDEIKYQLTGKIDDDYYAFFSFQSKFGKQFKNMTSAFSGRIPSFNLKDIEKLKDTLDGKKVMYYFISRNSPHVEGCLFADKNDVKPNLAKLAVQVVLDRKFFTFDNVEEVLQPGYISDGYAAGQGARTYQFLEETPQRIKILYDFILEIIARKKSVAEM